MEVFRPIYFSEGDLGQRHRHFNSLVKKVLKNDTSWQDIQKLPEHSPLDRLFKIEVASKLECVDYIIDNLKDNDLLYVSKALRSLWLLDTKYSHIINPTHLESILFPQMIVPAVSKIKHWLYIHLNDPDRCLTFYDYYKEKNFKFAIKFLRKCDDSYITEEFPKILSKISPNELKIFSEKCPKVAKIFFDALSEDMEVTRRYLSSQVLYYNSIKCVLKAEPAIFLDVTERFYNKNFFPKLSSNTTEYIIKHCKSRFMAKPELYTAWLLHVPTMAEQLTVAECEELVLKLARAKYLEGWFSYKACEPFIKRLSSDKRAAFKKKVFTDKDYGETIDKWPYPTPREPIDDTPVCHFFDDPIPDFPVFDMARAETYRGKAYGQNIFLERFYDGRQTELDRLFNEFRFHGFDYTFNKLSRKLAVAGSAETRRSMFLVLVSKAGGRTDNISVLLKLLERYTNEPDHIRAAVVRSLVMRAQVWRVPDDTWASFLEFGRGLGLDGDASESQCEEAFHAVILRLMLSKTEIPPKLSDTFLGKFSTLSSYKLSQPERIIIVDGLTRLLVSAASETNPKESPQYLLKLFQVYEDYKSRIDVSSPIIPAVRDLTERDAGAAKQILMRLYDARVARKELFLANLAFRQDDASYLNALRHDPSIITKQILNRLTNDNNRERKCYHRSIRRGQFMQKLGLYFNEDQGLAQQILELYKTNVATRADVDLAWPIAMLTGRDLKSYIKTLDARDGGIKKIVNALHVCSYHARPKLDLNDFKPDELEAKFITMRAFMCRYVDCEKYVKLLNNRKIVRAAIALSQRNGSEANTFAEAAQLRPVATVRAALIYFRKRGDAADSKVWEIVKPLITALDLSRNSRLQKTLSCVENIPLKFRPEYCATLYNTLNKSMKKNALIEQQRHLTKYWSDMGKETNEEILLKLLADTGDDISTTLFPSLFVRYLLLSESEKDQEERFEKIGQQFFDHVEKLSKTNTVMFGSYMHLILKCLKYNKVFFDTKYACCLLVIQRVRAWMQKILPVEECFKMNAEVHLTMLYCKAVRTSVTQVPGVLGSEGKKYKEGVVIVGTTFGRYIAKELRELVAKYFDSIMELYSDVVLHYVVSYFEFGGLKTDFLGAVIRGVLEESRGYESRVGLYILKDWKYSLNSEMRKELKGMMKEKDDATKFLCYAEFGGDEDERVT